MMVFMRNSCHTVLIEVSPFQNVLLINFYASIRIEFHNDFFLDTRKMLVLSGERISPLVSGEKMLISLPMMPKITSW